MELCLSSSFLGLPYRIPNIDHKKELRRGLWVTPALLREFSSFYSDLIRFSSLKRMLSDLLFFWLYGISSEVSETQCVHYGFMWAKVFRTECFLAMRGCRGHRHVLSHPLASEPCGFRVVCLGSRVFSIESPCLKKGVWQLAL